MKSRCHLPEPTTVRLLWFAACLGITWVAAAPFSANSVWRAGLAAAGAGCLYKGGLRIQSNRNRQRQQKQYLVFLQHLSGDLSAGTTLHAALMNSRLAMHSQLGAAAPVTRALENAIMDLHMQKNLRDVLSEIGNGIGLPEAKALFTVISSSLNLGHHVVHLVRDARDTAARMIGIENDTRAEQITVTVEAVCLSAMPFGMAWIFGGLTLAAPGSGRGPIANALLLLAFLISLGALYLSMHILNEPISDGAGSRRKKDSRLLRSNSVQKILSSPLFLSGILALEHQLPAFYVTEQKRMAAALNPGRNALQDTFGRRLLFAAALTAASLPPVLLGKLPWWLPLLLPPFAWFLSDSQLRTRHRKWEQSVERDLPMFLETLLRYLTCGETLLSGIRKTSDGGSGAALASVLRAMLHTLSNGQQLHQALTACAGRFSSLDIQTVFTLLAQYFQTGHPDILNALNIQKNACWQLYKKSRLQHYKTISTRLLLPMTLDLIAVMLLALTPALSIFTQF